MLCGLPGGSPPPKLRVHLQSLLPAWQQRHLFRDIRCYALFIGHNRSGSTLLGSLLNAHRHALIAHELNSLHFIKRYFFRLPLYWLIYQQDRAFAMANREWSGYDYRVPGQWQGKCEQIQVIGDKHAGGATTVLGQRPELLERLRRTVGCDVKMIHVVRHPLDNIATICQRESLSPAAGAESYFQDTATNARLILQNPGDVLSVHLEDMISQPAIELTRICTFLNLDAPADYLAACSRAVFAEPRRTRDNITWPQTSLHQVLDHCRQFPFLRRYCGNFHVHRNGVRQTAAKRFAA